MRSTHLECYKRSEEEEFYFSWMIRDNLIEVIFCKLWRLDNVLYVLDGESTFMCKGLHVRKSLTTTNGLIDLKISLYSSGLCGLVSWVSSHAPKGGQCDSLSGHMPSLQPSSSFRRVQEAANGCFTLMSVFLFLPLSLNINKKSF